MLRRKSLPAAGRHGAASILTAGGGSSANGFDSFSNYTYSAANSMMNDVAQRDAGALKIWQALQGAVSPGAAASVPAAQQNPVQTMSAGDLF